jgi:hypothetical protein
VLARQYLAAFGVGLVSARALFAARRMGKSQFLEKDLIPAARIARYVTVYLNLWDARSRPGPALIEAFARALEPKGWSKVAKRLKRPLKSLKASATLSGVAAGTLEAELATEGPAVARPLLSELIRGFDDPRKRMLLVLDEAQVLAEAEHADLAHALRAALDSRKATIKVVFAGSSEATLRRMFGRTREPFYNWAPLEPFELLGEAFVRAMVVKVNELSRYPIAVADAMNAFEALKRTPEFLRRFLDRYLSYAELGAAAALDYTRGHVFNDAAFASAWSALKPADRAALRLIAAGSHDLFSEAARRDLGAELRLRKSISISSVQNAMRRLQARDLIVRLDRGEYQVQDAIFAEWLRQRAPVQAQSPRRTH